MAAIFLRSGQLYIKVIRKYELLYSRQIGDQMVEVSSLGRVEGRNLEISCNCCESSWNVEKKKWGGIDTYRTALWICMYVWRCSVQLGQTLAYMIAEPGSDKARL